MGFRMIDPKRIKKVKTPGGQEVLRKLQEFLDESCKETAEFLCRFWKDQQNAITYKELRQAVMDGAISRETLRLWQQDYSVLVANRFRNVWEDAMKAGAVSQPVMNGKVFEFYTQTPGIMNWIQSRGAAFVTSCTQEQKAAISALLSKKMVEGHTVDELARMIRPCIGLTEGQAKANARYYDSIVSNLKKEHPRMRPESIQKKAQDAAAKYAERQHRQRAMTIAQTESAFAYNRGADEGIRQAQAQGLLGQMMKRWSTSGDDAVCSICQGLEGVELGMDEGFDFKGRLLFAEQNLMPPAHPRCACAVEYIEVEAVESQYLQIPMSEYQDITSDYLIRNYDEETDVFQERSYFEDAVLSVPSKVQQALEKTVIDIGKIGASQYDYLHDILYIAKGADKDEIIHEIGHLVENKLMNSDKVALLKQKILKEVMPNNFVNEVYYDASNNPVEIFLVKSEEFVSDYQGRVYINDWSELLDENMNIKQELFQEFISEPFREYIENAQRLKREFPEFYKLISEAVE